MGRNRPHRQLKTVFNNLNDVQHIFNRLQTIKDRYNANDSTDHAEVESFFQSVKDIIDSIKSKTDELSEVYNVEYERWKSENPSNTQNATLSEATTQSAAVEEQQTISETICSTDEVLASDDKVDDAGDIVGNNKEADTISVPSEAPHEPQLPLEAPVQKLQPSDASQPAVEMPVAKDTELVEDTQLSDTESNVRDAVRSATAPTESNAEEGTSSLTESSNNDESREEAPNGTLQPTAITNGDNGTDAASEENADQTAVDKPKVFLKCIAIDKLVEPKLLKKMKPVSEPILILSDSDHNDDDSQLITPVRTTRNFIRTITNRQDRPIVDKEPETPKAKQIEGRKSILVNSGSKKNSPQNESSIADERNAVTNKESATTSLKKRVRFDCSSSSSSSLSSDELTRKARFKKKRSKKEIAKGRTANGLDEKFALEAYVPLPQVRCEKLKDYYANKKLNKDIERLTDLSTLKKKRKRAPEDDKDDDHASTSPPSSPPLTATNAPTSSQNRSHKKSKESSDISDCSSDLPLEKNAREENESIPDVAAPADNVSKMDEEMLIKRLEKMVDSDSDRAKNDSNSDSTDEDCRATNDKETEKKNGEETAEKSKDCQPNEDNLPKEDSPSTQNSPPREDSSLKEKSSPKEDSPPIEKKEDGEGDKSDGTNHSLDEDDGVKKKKKSTWRKDKLLTSKLDSSDSEDEFENFKKKQKQLKEDLKAKLSRKKTLKILDSDSDSNDGSAKKKNTKKSDSSSSDEDEGEQEEEKEDSDVEEVEPSVPEKKKRRRIKALDNSDSSENEKEKSTRKNIRKVLKDDSLSESTKQAEKDEFERKNRILERQQKYNKIFDKPQQSDRVDKVVLDFDEASQNELLHVRRELVKHLKPHQAKGVQFMWDACFESIERTKKTTGSGCILAHCMGLGKTLQVIALVYTLLTNEKKTGVSKVLVVCPLNTVLNWVAEFNKWLADVDGEQIEVFELVSYKQNFERNYQVKEWHKGGGVLIIGYDMFRNLTNPNNKRLSKKFRKTFHEGLVSPGPDLVVCDEGHLLKNEKTNLSIAMNRLKTMRRIVLTGTPMQNNMKEYYCMVQFVKPNLLGTYKEYLNRFVNPITNGQYTDSTQHDINIMRKRSHVLHKMLDGIVQRKDYSVLTPFLPPKYEYVLFLTLTEVQIQLYSHYLNTYARKPSDNRLGRTAFLFSDFQEFQRICTHPRVLLDKSIEVKAKSKFDDEEEEDSEGSLKDFIDDDDDSESTARSTSDADSDKDNEAASKPSSTRGRARVTRATAAAEGIDVEKETKVIEQVASENEWWRQFCTGPELDNIRHSSKLYLLFEILQQCEAIGDKLLVFSQSLYSLNVIEYFLTKIDEATQNGESEKVCGFSGSWALGLDYFRLDGSSSCDSRSIWCNSFNNPDNPRARLFLISTKAGGLGINLVAANRVIIFDVSWNPSHDLQSIYRVYRFGQTKPCYIYRFVTFGTMEMKIYERQVTKQAISKRVIDEQQIDRHYNQNDLAELYNFTEKPEEVPIPLVPKDVLLGELIQSQKDRIYKYHEHQSLLENIAEEELNEEERKAAWEEFESEKTARAYPATIMNIPMTTITMAIANIIRKDNPAITQQQLETMVPEVVKIIQLEILQGTMTTFNRVTAEIRLMQAQQQKMYQELVQQQAMRIMQQQLMYAHNNKAGTSANTSNNKKSNNVKKVSNEIIELND